MDCGAGDQGRVWWWLTARGEGEHVVGLGRDENRLMIKQLWIGSVSGKFPWVPNQTGAHLTELGSGMECVCGSGPTGVEIICKNRLKKQKIQFIGRMGTDTVKLRLGRSLTVPGRFHKPRNLWGCVGPNLFGLWKDTVIAGQARCLPCSNFSLIRLAYLWTVVLSGHADLPILVIVPSTADPWVNNLVPSQAISKRHRLHLCRVRLRPALRFFLSPPRPESDQHVCPRSSLRAMSWCADRSELCSMSNKEDLAARKCGYPSMLR